MSVAAGTIPSNAQHPADVPAQVNAPVSAAAIGTPSQVQPQPSPVATPSEPSATSVSTDNVVAMVEKARQDEKAKVYKTIEKLKADLKERDGQLGDLNKRVEEMTAITNKDLTKDQRVALQFENLRKEIEAEKAARAESEKQAQEQIRLSNLDAYRHRRLAEVGPTLIPELVVGTNQEEIEASIMVAQAEYQRLRNQFHAEFTSQYHQQPQPGVVPSASPGVQSPHFTPPAAGFPSPVSPVPVMEHTLDLNSVAMMTSEEAVRSGNYEKYRGQLLDRIRSLSPVSGSRVLGSAPRFSPAPTHGTAHQAMPNNVMQPMGNPTGPTMPTSMYQVPSPMTPHPGQPASMDPRAAAMAALDRTNSGQNPLLASQAHLAPPGSIPQGGALAAQAAFDARFQPTPPVNPGQGQ